MSLDFNFILIVILAAWVGICEIRINKLEKKIKDE